MSGSRKCVRVVQTLAGLGNGREEVFSEAEGEIRGSIAWETRSHTTT